MSHKNTTKALESQQKPGAGEIHFDDLKEESGVPNQQNIRNQFIFSEISNLNDQIEDGRQNDLDDKDLQALYRNNTKDSFPPRMSQEKFEEDLMASI
jgi:hypothetical protein